MHEVGLVLQEVVDALDDVPFTQHYLVPHGHEPVPFRVSRFLVGIGI